MVSQLCGVCSLRRRRSMSREKEIRGMPGWTVLFLTIAVLVAAAWSLVQGILAGSPWVIVLALAALVLGAVSFGGFTVVNPNQAKVLTLFGVYKGSLKEAGFWWVN